MRFVIVALFMVLATTAGDCRPYEGEHQQPTQQHPADQPAAESNRIPTEVLGAGAPAERHDDGGTKDSQEQPQHYLLFGEPPAQWLMAAAAVGGFLVSVWAVCLLKQTLNATRDAIREARKGTVAANRATEVTREIGQAQVRAYVFPIAAKLVGTNSATPNVNIQFKNTGATPAYGVVLTWHVAATHASEGFEIPKTKLPRIQPNIGPAQPITVSRYIQPLEWASILLELQNGVMVLHAFGTLRYTDAFKNRRYTNFRMKVLVSAGKIIADDDFVFCDDGNDSD